MARIDNFPDPNDLMQIPVYWAEVYSRANKEWITVDVTRKAIRIRDKMEPPKSSRTNKMTYVLVIEEGKRVISFAIDVH